eukprot:212004_1
MENKSHCTLWVTFITGVSGIMTISTIPVLFVYVKTQTSKAIKSLYYCGMLFLVNVILALFANFILAAFWCRYEQVPQWLITSYDIFFIFYWLQNYCLLSSFFLRLYHVFKGTTFALSSTTIRTFQIQFIILLIILLVALITARLIAVVFWYMFVLYYLMTIILTISMTTLFINKLVKSYKNINTDEGLIDMITKTFMLSQMSLFITIMVPVIAIFVSDIYLRQLIMLLDLYTNFLCIVFSYGTFLKYYMKMCGFCHVKCKIICYKIIIGGSDIKMAASASSMDSTTDPTGNTCTTTI